MTTDSTITPELLDQLLANYKKPEDLTGVNGLFKQLKKALIERALGAELTAAGTVEADPTGLSSVAGLYVAGDAATQVQSVAVATGSGARAAYAINAALALEDAGVAAA